jgi:SOS-response transcriptional repressor LexA
MARRKNRPETIREKCCLAERLRQVRVELYGERGGSEMARRLGVPIRTWYNYESGVTVPAEVLLRFLELTQVEPQWLLHGTGPVFRSAAMAAAPGGGPASVVSLLRTVLSQLESKARPPVLDGLRAAPVRPGAGEAGNGDVAAAGAWVQAEREGRCVRVEGDAMTPLLADGAQVAFAAGDEPIDALDGALVVAWVDGEPVVRWFRRSGGFGLLRAENPEYLPNLQLLDLATPGGERRVRRVEWISTPH